MVESCAGLQKRSYLQEGVKSRLQLLTPDDGLFAHLKEVDKGWVGLDQLTGLEEEGKGREGEGKVEGCARDLRPLPQIGSSGMTSHFPPPNHQRAQ